MLRLPWFSFSLYPLWYGDKVTVAMKDNEIIMVCGGVVCSDRDKTGRCLQGAFLGIFYVWFLYGQRLRMEEKMKVF